MKIFMNKKIWQKIVIIILLLLGVQFVMSPPVHAVAGDVLLEPITSLFANLGDGIMNIMQKTIMGMEASGAWIEKDNGLWAKIAMIGTAILCAVIAVAAIVLSAGTLTMAVVATAAGAVLKVVGVATIVYCAASVTHFGESGFYLPNYELTPQRIFQNEILAFDVNFFNPKADKIKTITKSAPEFKKEDYSIEYEGYLYEKGEMPKIDIKNAERVIGNGGPTENTFTLEKNTPEWLAENWASTVRKNYKKESY